MSGRRLAILSGLALLGGGCQAAPGLPARSGASPTATAVAGPSSWTMVHTESLPNGGLADVVEFGGRLVVVGSTGAGPIILTSPDGRTWTRLPDDPGLVSEGTAGIRSVVAWKGSLVAVGTGDGQYVVWQSGDGHSWTLAFQSKPVTAEDYANGLRFEGGMGSVAAGPATLVATGVTAGGLAEDLGGAAWRSRDGLEWISAGPTIALLRGPIWDVASDARGGFVAVGGIGGAVTWTTVDGERWVMHEQADTLSRGQLYAVALAADSGLVTVGSEQEQGFSATSEDGAAWLRGTCNGAMTLARLRTVARTATGYVAGGSVDLRAALWVSSDALTWSRVKADLGEGTIESLLVRDDSIVAVGTQIWLGAANGFGGDGLYPDTPCGAPIPDAPVPGPTLGPGEEPAVESETPAEAPAEAPTQASR